jgi:hypothetical protein
MRHWRPGERYYGGVWSGSVVKDLLWERKPFQGVPARSRTGPDDRRTGWSSDKWLFPTWSWASLNNAKDTGLTEYPIFWNRTITGKQRLYADDAFLVRVVDELLEDDSGARDDDPAAEKKPRCELQVEGTVFPLSHETLLKAHGEAEFCCDYGDFSKDDWKTHVDPQATLCCLRMMKSDGHFIALVLVCTDEDARVYERFGFLEWDRGLGVSTIANVVVDKKLRPEWWAPSDGAVPEPGVITLV